MATIRIEAVEDPQSGRYGLEIFFPEDSERPLVTTAARYASAAAAENDLIALISSGANNRGGSASTESPAGSSG